MKIGGNMKKLLFLTLTVSYGLQALTPAPTFDPYSTQNVYLEQIDPVTIPLGQESQSWVNRWSILGTVAGVALGAGTYMFLPEHIRSANHQQSDITDTLYGATASVVGAIVGYFGTNLCATGYTPEKIEESKTNSLISDYNIAAKAVQLVSLSPHERRALSRLPFNNPEKDQNRLEVYQGISVPTSRNPITDRVNYVRNLTVQLDQEKIACEKLTTSRIEQLRSSSLVGNAAQIAQIIEQNKRCIAAMNSLVPQQAMKRWYGYVEKRAPEYTAENIYNKAALLKTQITRDEEIIKRQLARLAALYGYTFSQADLCSNIWHFILLDLDTNYPNTREGRIARQNDIKDTKNHISRLMQNYQNKVIDYGNAAAEHNDVQRDLNNAIANFVVSHGGQTKGIKGFKANRRLLEYNNYLNHSDGNALWNWIQSCFDN